MTSTTDWQKRNRKYQNSQKRSWHARKTLLTPEPRSGHWNSTEDQIVLREDITIYEKAVMLNRNYSSVSSRVNALRNAEEVVCANCNSKFFKIKPSVSHKPFHTRGLYCSRACHYSAVRAAGYSRNSQQCEQCGNTFRARARGAKFCSLKCFGAYKRINHDRLCGVCGESFTPKGDRKYCSYKCSGAAKSRAAEVKNTKSCESCQKSFVSQSGRTKYCSRSCFNDARWARPSSRKQKKGKK